MQDLHIFLYGALFLLTLTFLFVAYRPLQAILFDKSYAKSLGLSVEVFEAGLSFLLLFSLIVGMRSVGIVLMAGMLIAPAVAARAFSDQLKVVFLFAALFGALSGFLGQLLSIELSIALSSAKTRLFLPTGPMIVLVSTLFAFFSLLFAPKRGLAFRSLRAARFQMRCLEENVLKGLWKKGQLSFPFLQKMHQVFWGKLFFVLFRLKRFGFVEKHKSAYQLTHDGEKKAASIVRLHRLWELYLAQEMGFQGRSVHQNAEEIEHILTPDLEAKLTLLLENPKRDPHLQPIPEK